MAEKIVMPQLGESIAEGTIVKWLKKPGDVVKKDENLLLISTDKVEAEIPSPSAGTSRSRGVVPAFRLRRRPARRCRVRRGDDQNRSTSVRR